MKKKVILAKVDKEANVQDNKATEAVEATTKNSGVNEWHLEQREIGGQVAQALAVLTEAGVVEWQVGNRSTGANTHGLACASMSTRATPLSFASVANGLRAMIVTSLETIGRNSTDSMMARTRTSCTISTGTGRTLRGTRL